MPEGRLYSLPISFAITEPYACFISLTPELDASFTSLSSEKSSPFEEVSVVPLSIVCSFVTEETIVTFPFALSPVAFLPVAFWVSFPSSVTEVVSAAMVPFTGVG